MFFDILIEWLKIKLTIYLLLAVILGQFAYMFMSKGHESAVMNQFVLGESCDEAIEALPDPLKMPRTILLPLAGDIDSMVTTVLSSRLKENGRYTLIEPSTLNKIKKEFNFSDPITTLEEAHRFGRAMGVERVFFGEVTNFTQGEDNAHVEFLLRGTDTSIEHPNSIFMGTYGKNIRTDYLSLPFLRAHVRDSSAGNRLVIWVLTTLALPFLTYFLVKVIIQTESNAAILLLLSGYTLFDGLLAYVLMGMGTLTLPMAFVLIFSIVLSGFYNHRVCTAIKDYEG